MTVSVKKSDDVQIRYHPLFPHHLKPSLILPGPAIFKLATFVVVVVDKVAQRHFSTRRERVPDNLIRGGLRAEYRMCARWAHTKVYYEGQL